MKRIALLAVLMSVSSTAFAWGATINGRSANGTRNNGLNGSTNGRSANSVRNNGKGPQGATPSVQVSGEGPSGLKVPRASARNGRLFVR